MAGAPSHLEMLDYKPQLAKFNGTLPPASLLENYRAAFINPNSRLLGPVYNFSQQGQSGAWVSELLPHFSEIVVDDLCRDPIDGGRCNINHNGACADFQMNTGEQAFSADPSHGVPGRALRSRERKPKPPRVCRFKLPLEPVAAAAPATGAASFLPAVLSRALLVSNERRSHRKYLSNSDFNRTTGINAITLDTLKQLN